MTRQRGLWLGAAVGALSLVLVLAWRDGARALGSPGPLARPHAAVACAGCHATRAAGASCGGCHEAHPSERPAHRALASAGSLVCATCHAIHRAETGVAWSSNGALSLYGTGFEEQLAAPDAAPPSDPINGIAASAPSRTTFVPLVSAAACASCHATTNPADPAFACLTDAPGGFSLCFDEHRRPASLRSANATDRDAAVERARVVARQHPRASLFAWFGWGTNAACVALGLGIAGLVTQRLRREKPRRTSEATRPTVLPAARRLPLIDATRCLGCHACVDACPYDALAVKRYVAVLARPEACCGAGPCQDSCPNGSLRLVEGGGERRGPALSAELEALEQPGVFLAGDVTGGTLIRNALRQGTVAARQIAARLATRPEPPLPGVHDLVVVGAGPAGLAAGLTARALGLSVLVLDQAGIAASIRRFSREKLVLDAASGDEALPLFIGDAKKEELVLRWQRSVRQARLEVREGARVLAVRREPGGGRFTLSAELGDAPLVLSARAVLIATGTRGTPRPLEVPVPDAAASLVHYDLSDARAFAQKRVIVVGLGDVAMESALALAAQPGTHVTLLARGSGFRRGSQRNIDAVARLVARGRVTLSFDTRVKCVALGRVEVEAAGLTRTLAYDAIFVHVGSIPTAALLESAGIASAAE